MTETYIDEDIKNVRRLHASMLSMDRSTISICEYLSMQAERIREAHAQGDTSTRFHLGCWCKPLIGKSPDEIMQTKISIDLAQETIAREHGYSDWDTVESLGDTQFDNRFESCIDSLLNGDINSLSECLTQEPGLAKQQSQYGHQATLLHYLAANGVESYRQMTPLNATQLAQCLLDAGANVNANANVYGGSKVLGLLVSSAHPANAGVTDELAALLRQAGAC